MSAALESLHGTVVADLSGPEPLGAPDGHIDVIDIAGDDHRGSTDISLDLTEEE